MGVGMAMRASRVPAAAEEEGASATAQVTADRLVHADAVQEEANLWRKRASDPVERGLLCCDEA